MTILDPQPCRYCGHTDYHELTCEFGVAEVAARMLGKRAEWERVRGLIETLRDEWARSAGDPMNDRREDDAFRGGVMALTELLKLVGE